MNDIDLKVAELRSAATIIEEEPPYNSDKWAAVRNAVLLREKSFSALVDILEKTIATAVVMKDLGDPWGQVVLDCVDEILGQIAIDPLPPSPRSVTEPGDEDGGQQ
ncbi:MAG: hypothetical protein GTN69_10525 [Armatimonadetes bacterium]|nr:hypothetical protein [Armatimonadota bacterium]